MAGNSVIAVLSYAAVALNLALAAYVLYKNPRRLVNIVFALMAVSLSIWALGDAGYNVSHAVSLKTFWVRFQGPGEILFPALFLSLALLFPEPFPSLKGNRKYLVAAAIYLPAVFTLVCFYATDWVFAYVENPTSATGLTTKGWLYWAYAGFSYTLLFLALALYIYRYYRSKRLREKRVAQVMAAAVAVPLLVNILENSRLYRLSSTPCFFALAAAVFAYGILRHQMFVEVESVLRRSIVYFTLAVLITSAYVVTILVTERFVSSYFSAQGFIVTAVFVVVLVLIFEPLRRMLMNWVDRFFFRKDYEFGKMLESLSRSLAELDSLDRISGRITGTLADEMALTGAALLYEPDSSGGWRRRTVRGFVPDYMEFPGEPEADYTGGSLELRGEKSVGPASFDVLEVPLLFERERVGLLLLGEKLSGYDFSYSDRSLLETMAPQIAVALKNGALFQEVLEKQRRVNELVEKVAGAHEDERRRIARDLHDGVAQSFLGVVYLSDFALEELRGDQVQQTIEDMEKLSARARDGLDELRGVIDDLRPVSLDVLGLKGAAGKLAGDIASTGALEVELECDIDDVELPALVESNLFRILQEALSNALKHAKAARVRVELGVVGSAVRLVVADDGTGIDTGGSRAGGHGMSSMRERAEEMGGELELSSEVNQGTTITVTVPLDGEDPDGES